MHADDWNSADDLDFGLFSPINLFDRGHEGLDDILDVVEAAGDELHPKTLLLKKDKHPYSRKLLHERFAELQYKASGHTVVTLSCAQVSQAFFRIGGYQKGEEESRFTFQLHLKPFSWCAEPGKQEARASALIELVRTLAARLPLSYGLAHSNTDRLLDTDLDHPSPWVPAQVERVHWLNVYGARLIQHLGRERVLTTPAWHIEQLPHGAVLLLTRPTPVDFASDEARLAQARALVHLHPGASLEATLAQLHQRSLAFIPLDSHFHPDVKEILQKEVEFQGLLCQRSLVERFNHYQPPPVSEWVPTAQQPGPDMPEPGKDIDLYEGLHAERLLALMHKEVPSVMRLLPEALPQLDWHAWHLRWVPGDLTDSDFALLHPALGAYLGLLLVREFQGKWVPRRNLDEAAVVVGDRAFRPFLRARHSLKDRQAALDHSLTQFFREAQRTHARSTSA